MFLPLFLSGAGVMVQCERFVRRTDLSQSPIRAGATEILKARMRFRVSAFLPKDFLSKGLSGKDAFNPARRDDVFALRLDRRQPPRGRAKCTTCVSR
ncbi:MAG: hypothetical protein J0G95_13000 [Rhizobiales bacterium]|nr:hypothetical protein [Hyphomicrobiales bacterium]